MKTMLLSCALILGVSVAVLAEEPRTAAPNPAGNKTIDGTWTVLCAEKDGQPMGEAKDITVMVKDNVFMVKDKDGKEMKLKMEFTGPGMAKVTEEGSTKDDATKTDKAQGSKSAVYVLTNDFLSICVHHDKAEGDVKPASATEPAAGKASSKSYCSFVLKRTDGERK